MPLLESNAFDANASLVGVNSDHAALGSAGRTSPVYDLYEVASSNFLHGESCLRAGACKIAAAAGGKERLCIRQTRAFVKVPAGKKAEIPRLSHGPAVSSTGEHGADHRVLSRR